MGKSFEWDDGGLIKNLKAMDNKMDAFIFASISYHAQRAQSYARQNARWTDRTGNARNGLFGKAIRNKPSYALVVGGTVTYQPWLEVRWSGRYAIIVPTLRREGSALMNTLSKGFSAIT